ncbi:MAG: adenylate/guanylate cyclase domain-containing protein [Planctomycetes bacterium]|nr:adenylate/guanylate cyclase domain-containing protein [Planctomycetota bacterium]
MRGPGHPHHELRRVPRRKRALWGAAAGLALGLAACALSLVEGLGSVESMTIDLRHGRLARPTDASRQVAVVLVDEYSIQELRRVEGVRFFPWPRDVYEAVVLYLKEAGAKAIVFDILFNDPWPAAKIDQALADAAREAGNVVFAAKLDHLPPGVEPFEGEAAEAERRAAETALAKARVDVPGWPFGRWEGVAIDQLVAPIPELAEAARGVGFVNVRQDPDNTLRRAELLQPGPDGKTLVASLPLAAALAALGPEAKPALEGRELLVGGKRIPLSETGRPLVRFYGKEDTIRPENAVSVIRSLARLGEGQPPLVPPEAFKDKVVFVGINASGFEDVVTAPVSDRLPGAEYQATVCANILGGEFLRELGSGARAALFLAVGLAGGLAAFLAWRPVPAAAATLAVFAAHAGLAVWLFREGTIVSVLELFFPAVELGGAFLAATLSAYFLEGRQKREVSRAFGQYLSPVVIRELMRDPGSLRLGGETREVVVYFSDIKGFSGFSHGMPSERLVSFLNVYLTAMSDVILDSGGLVDKYIGDAVMAFWGAPQPAASAARDACLAVVEQRRILRELNVRFRAEGYPPIEFRVGLNLGTATVGNMGSARRFNYTAMGDTVNLASRLEGANKFFGSHVLMTRDVRASAGEAVVARRLGRVQVVGIDDPVEVHELLGRAGAFPADGLRRIERYHEALALLERGASAEAVRALEELLGDGRGAAADPVIEMLLERSRRIAASGAPWDGVWVLTEKG